MPCIPPTANPARAARTIILATLALAAACIANTHANDATRPVPRDDEPRWLERHSEINETVKANPDADLLFIGDSITDFWRIAGKEVWAQWYSGRKALNLGITSDRTQHVLWRLQNGNLEGLSPTAAVLLIGTNNFAYDDPSEIADGVHAIVQTLRQKLPNTKILLLGIFPRGQDPAQIAELLNATNALIAQIAEDPMVIYLDIGQAFLEKDGTLSNKIMWDYLHPTADGYQRWALAIEPTLLALLSPDEDEARTER